MKVVSWIYLKETVMNESWTVAETSMLTRLMSSELQHHPHFQQQLLSTLDPRGNSALAAINFSNATSVEPRSCMSTILITLVLAVIVLLTITGNVLVIASVVLNGNLRTTTNYFIANLAIADLLLGTTVLPFSATLEVLQYWVFGQFFCDVWAAIDVLCCTASILSLCVISIDRYIGVTRPLQHGRIMGLTRAVYIIIFVWLLSMAISVAPLIGWKEEGDPDPRVCTVTTQPGYVLFSVAGSFYIPCLIILIVYFRIYQETAKYTKCLLSGAKLSKVDEENVVSLRIHTGRLTRTCSSRSRQADIVDDEASGGGISHQLMTKKEGGGGCKRNSRLTFSNKVAKFKREKKAAKTLGIVVGVFITCWLPFFVILPLDSLCSSCYVPPLLFKMFFWLGYCNSTMNPIIYTCSSLEFRRAFFSILCCRRCRTRPRVSLTELQLKAKVAPPAMVRHARVRRHARHHHQEQRLQMGPLQMTRCSPSTAGFSTAMSKGSPSGEQSLMNPYMGCECIIPECGKSGHGIIRYCDKMSVPSNKCVACSSNGHVQMKMLDTDLRRELSVYASIDHGSHRTFHEKSSQQRSVDHAGSTQVSTNSSNSTLSSTSSLDSSTRGHPMSGNSTYISNNAHESSKERGSNFGETDGVLTLSFYSLAETISCSD